jgi:tetratricopeptide (TPR) repeat protein
MTMEEAELERLRLAMQTAPADVEAHLALLQGLVTGEYWEEAETVGDALLQHETPPEASHALLGVVYAKRARLQEAAEQCRQALSFNADDALVLFNLGTVLARQGEYEEARQMLEQAKARQEVWAELYFNLGVVALHQGRYNDALDAFESATEQREGYAEAHFSRGNVHAVKGLGVDGSLDYYEIDCAINAYKAAVQHRPQYTAALYNLGMLYGRMSSSEGVRVWEQYLEAAQELEAEATWRMRAQEYKRDLEDRLR